MYCTGKVPGWFLDMKCQTCCINKNFIAEVFHISTSMPTFEILPVFVQFGMCMCTSVLYLHLCQVGMANENFWLASEDRSIGLRNFVNDALGH